MSKDKRLLILSLLLIFVAFGFVYCGDEDDDDNYTYTPSPWQICADEASTAYNSCIDSQCINCVGIACLYCMASCNGPYDMAAYQCCNDTFSGDEVAECYDHFNLAP